MDSTAKLVLFFLAILIMQLNDLLNFRYNKRDTSHFLQHFGMHWMKVVTFITAVFSGVKVSIFYLNRTTNHRISCRNNSLF